MSVLSNLKETYDYIVVGGGSSGCVVANRLSEDEKVTVLLIEAGTENIPLNGSIPAKFPELQLTQYDWQYKTIEQENSHKRQFNWPRGKIIGGSSGINAMLYVRGNAEDYNKWSHELGCTGWSYNEVLPYFIKSEKCRLKTCQSEFHGQSGSLVVNETANGEPNIIAKKFVEACNESGILYNPDYNGSIQEGAALSQTTTTENGTRCCTSTAFINAEIKKQRSNMTVLSSTHVKKLLFQGKRAVGVVCSIDEQTKKLFPAFLTELTFKVKNEVILCAGAIGSPHILMLSGIGPSDTLDAAGISQITDLPVGKNLQDHVGAPMVFEEDSTLAYNAGFGIHLILPAFKYLFKRTGMVASTLIEAMAFFRTGQTPEWNAPDMQFHFMPGKGDHKLSKAMAYDEAVSGVLGNPSLNSKSCVTVIPTILHPRSIGRITLRDSDPFSHPIIDPCYYHDPNDIKVMVAGMKKARDVMNASAFKGITSRKHEVRLSAIDCKVNTESDQYLEEYAKRCAMTFYHPVGTCKMGPASDINTVVLSNLKLKGFENVRVADASVMPTLPSGNTNAPSIMIGEKAADLIKAESKLKRQLSENKSNGGKDSTFNMMHCVANGHEIVALANLYPESKGEIDSYMYQSVGWEMIEAIAECMQKPLYREAIQSGKALNTDMEYKNSNADDEVEDLYRLLLKVKNRHPEIEAVSVGAIFSSYQNIRVNNVCKRLSLEPLAYLWQKNQDELMVSMIKNNVNAILIKIASMGLCKEHLGLSLSEMLPVLRDLHEKYESNICGEGGEFESLTLDCPLFLKRIIIEETEMVLHSDNYLAPVYYLIIKKYRLEDKSDNNGEMLYMD